MYFSPVALSFCCWRDRSKHRTLASLGKWADLRTTMRAHKRRATRGEPLIRTKAFYCNISLFIVPSYYLSELNLREEYNNAVIYVPPWLFILGYKGTLPFLLLTFSEYFAFFKLGGSGNGLVVRLLLHSVLVFHVVALKGNHSFPWFGRLF